MFTIMAVTNEADEIGRGRDYDTIEEARKAAIALRAEMVRDHADFGRVDIWTIDEVYGDRLEIVESL